MLLLNHPAIYKVHWHQPFDHEVTSVVPVPPIQKAGEFFSWRLIQVTQSVSLKKAGRDIIRREQSVCLEKGKQYLQNEGSFPNGHGVLPSFPDVVQCMSIVPATTGTTVSRSMV